MSEWTEERLDEFEALEQLLSLCCRLNHSNRIVENIQECERLANKLTHNRIGDGPNFLQFIRQLAIDSRRKVPPC